MKGFGGLKGRAEKTNSRSNLGECVRKEVTAGYSY